MVVTINDDFAYVFEHCPWVLGKVPVVTMSFIEHVLKLISKMTMEIVIAEIRKFDEDFYK